MFGKSYIICILKIMSDLAHAKLVTCFEVTLLNK